LPSWHLILSIFEKKERKKEEGEEERITEERRILIHGAWLILYDGG